MAIKRSLIATVKGIKDGGTFDPQQFSKDVSKAYREKSTKFTKKVSFSPSSIVYGNGTCARYWYFAFNGTDFERSVDAAGVATMANGSDAGVRLAKVIEKTGRLVEAEREAKYADPPIRGYIDIVVDQDGKEIIGEIKCIRDDLFQGVTDSHDPKGYHLLQLLLYMYITDHDEGFVMYENKNTHEIAIMPVIMNDRTRKIVERAITWMEEVYESYKEDKVPAHGFAQTSYQCKGCPVKKTCWADTRVDVTIDNLKVG
jgi:CRISPR/Cas system-associated exonuclease Cas4 (RecB family)